MKKMVEVSGTPGRRAEEFRMPRMEHREDPEAYLEAFERMTTEAR